MTNIKQARIDTYLNKKFSFAGFGLITVKEYLDAIKKDGARIIEEKTWEKVTDYEKLVYKNGNWLGNENLPAYKAAKALAEKVKNGGEWRFNEVILTKNDCTNKITRSKIALNYFKGVK